ncbi:hypothetical protein [Saccharopolyspora spinosa]|uniref:Uncharacterized protein n=1 Tax=Saccharopolyspora spinosa TaxID=60894 RepID=A0A2N3XRU3_SACSN|nr:hypothetical protein [Saccharopolyspora spinosa]PKW13361.1 hypothetical protein A8926_0885 [Saccharopolyspora spinosa]
MFWIQLSTFVLFNLLILALLTTQLPARAIAFSTAQHAGGGEGAYTVWHLIADIEAETRVVPEEHRAEQEHPHIPTKFPTTDPDAPEKPESPDEPTGRHHLHT